MDRGLGPDLGAKALPKARTNRLVGSKQRDQWVEHLNYHLYAGIKTQHEANQEAATATRAAAA